MGKILLVDDNDVVRHALERVLRHAGHEVTEAADGNVALSLAGRGLFELVITDIVMPNVEGIELIRRLRKNVPSLPIIAISGGGLGDLDTYLAMARVLGVKATLPKPPDTKELLRIVDTLLSPAS